MKHLQMTWKKYILLTIAQKPEIPNDNLNKIILISNSLVQWNLQNTAEGDREDWNKRRCKPFLSIRGLHIVKLSILNKTDT